MSPVPGALSIPWLISLCAICLGLCTAGEIVRFYGLRALGNALLILATLFAVAVSAAVLYASSGVS